MTEEKRIEYWFKLTYDADPKIRLKAAKELSNYPESPTAVFAIYELTYDKNDHVKESAKKIISAWKKEKTEIIPLGEILAEKITKKEEPEEGKEREERIEELKKKLMPTLEKYFESEKSKKKLMPSLEKLFERLAEVESKGHKTFEITKKAKPGKEGKEGKEGEEKIGQRSLFDEEEEIEMPPEYKEYLDTLAQIDRIAFAKPGKRGRKKKIEVKRIKEQDEEDVEEMLKEVEVEAEMEEEKIPVEDVTERTIYRTAFKLHTTPGLTQKLINDEMKRMIKEYSLKIKSAFALAKLRSKRNEIESISELEKGMKNIYTPEFKVEEVEQKEVRRGTRTTSYLRLVISDKTGSFPVFIWKGRGRGIYENDHIKFEKAFVDEYPEIGETALSVDKKGKIVVIK